MADNINSINLPTDGQIEAHLDRIHPGFTAVVREALALQNEGWSDNYGAMFYANQGYDEALCEGYEELRQALTQRLNPGLFGDAN